MNFYSTHFYICDLMSQIFQFKKYIYQEKHVGTDFMQDCKNYVFDVI